MASAISDNTIEVFFSYSHKDESLRAELDAHLASLKRQRAISAWNDRQIDPGDAWRDQIESRLNSADLILLLVSADFLSSDFCYCIETSRALHRHDAGDARVIPIIVRPVDWRDEAIGKIQSLPRDAKPITTWENRDQAWLNVVEGIRAAIEAMAAGKARRERDARLLPAHIPRPPRTGFVARRDRNGRDLLERLREELAPHRNQIVTLWGSGGVGKTTLAAETLRAMAGEFAGRIVWTGPQLRTDFGLSTLLDEIAAQLGRADLRTARPDEKPDLVSALLAESAALVVLDNFETIAGDQQPLCAAWLIDAPSAALITTRDRIDGTRDIPIAAMSVPEAEEFFARLLEQVHDRDSFAGLDAHSIIETAERNPLVMQWIVAQIDEAQAPRAVLAELRQGEGEAARRVFDRSFDLEQLGNDGRAALLALALFVPDASRTALAEVAGFGDDLKRLNEAVRRLSRLWLAAAKDGGERLAIERLTREMARSRIKKLPDGGQLKQRFIAHFLDYAKSYAQPKPKPEDYDALEAEKDNLLAAMDAAFEMQDWQAVTRMVDAIDANSNWLGVRGYWDDVRERREQALAAARNLQDETGIARYAHNLAMIHQKQGNLAEARNFYQQSLRIARKLGNQSGIAITLHQLGMLAQDQGNLDEARNLYQQSLDIARKLSNQSVIASTLHQLGNLAQDQGNLDEARNLYQQSLDIARKLGDQSGIAGTLHQFGQLAEEEGDKTEAARLFRESLVIFERLKSPDEEIVRSDLERVEKHTEG